MEKNIRMTGTTMTVLDAFLSAVPNELSGSQILRETRLMTGTLYPILHRLKKAGWLVARFEDIDPKEEGRPRRRFYKLKGEAQRVAFEELTKRGYFDGEPWRPGGGHVPA